LFLLGGPPPHRPWEASGALLCFWALCVRAMDNALSKFCCLFRRAVKAYQAAPLRGRPLSLGMRKSRAMTRISIQWPIVLLLSKNSDFGLSNSECIISHPRLADKQGCDCDMLGHNGYSPSALCTRPPRSRERPLPMGLAARPYPHLNGEEMGVGGLYLRLCQALHRVSSLLYPGKEAYSQ
jgi:hypothetical protein